MKEIDFRKLQESFGDMIRMQEEHAKYIREAYVQFVKQGFTEEQAMYLITGMVWYPFDTTGDK